MSESLGISLKDMREWLEQDTIPIVDPLRKKARRLLDNFKAKLDNVLETTDKMLDAAEKEIAKEKRKTYRRAKVMSKLALNVSGMIDEITIPNEISQENLNAFCKEAEEILGKIGQERWKWFPVVSPYFIIDRRRFDVASKRAADSLQELRSFVSEEYAKAGAVENAFSIIDKLHQSLGELDENEKRKKKMELRKEVLNKKTDEGQQRIKSIQSQNEIVELDKAKEEVEDLEKKVKHNLRHLQKPFLKFQSLAESSNYSLFLDEKKKLDEYLINPFEAFATEDEGYPMLKRVLKKMDEATDQGKLRLKKSRLRKAKDQTHNILHKDTLRSLHQSCKKALSKKQQLATSGIIAKSKTDLVQLQKNLRDLQKQKKLLSSRSAVLEGRIKETLTEIEDQKRELEEIVFESTDKKIQVLL